MPNYYIFSFIKYIKPIWYFNLKSYADIPYWVDYNLLSEADKQLINFDTEYLSSESSLRDAAYQAWQKGIFTFDSSYALKLVFELNNSLPVTDQYHFVKKYFNSLWVLLIFINRIICLHNPIKEIKGLFMSFKISKYDVCDSVKHWDDSVIANTDFIENNPIVSIIIPTLNRYEYLDDVLKDLEKQDYKNFEVLICDQSEPLNGSFYEDRNLKLTLIRQKEKALWKARNQCVKTSKGEYLLFFDDDSRVNSDWITNHLKCINYFKVKVSSGISLSKVGDKIPNNYNVFRWGDQVDTGNVMVHRSVFNVTGLFDLQFEKMRMGDGEFGARCFTHGIANVNNPMASRIHLKVGTGGLRHMGAWDAFRGNGFFSPIPIPSVLYYTRKYYGNKVALYNTLINLPFAASPYKFKGSKLYSLLGMFVFIVLLPKYLFQVLKSWNKSSIMLQQGAYVEKL